MNYPKNESRSGLEDDRLPELGPRRSQRKEVAFAIT